MDPIATLEHAAWHLLMTGDDYASDDARAIVEMTLAIVASAAPKPTPYVVWQRDGVGSYEAHVLNFHAPDWARSDR